MHGEGHGPAGATSDGRPIPRPTGRTEPQNPDSQTAPDTQTGTRRSPFRQIHDPTAPGTTSGAQDAAGRRPPAATRTAPADHHREAFTAQPTDCPWGQTCTQLHEGEDLWAADPAARGHYGMIVGRHRHQHDQCRPHPDGGMEHPDDHGQPHDRCEPDGHLHGLDPWPAAAYAIIGQMSLPGRVRRLYQQIGSDLADPCDIAARDTADLETLIRPAGLAHPKTLILRSVANLFCRNPNPEQTLGTGGFPGFGEATVRLWRSTMRP